MMIPLRHMLAAGFLAIGMLGMSAQTDDGFDLTSQRSEKQSINPVPGQKVVGRQFVINPTPHELTMAEVPGSLNPAEGFNTKGVNKVFAADLGFLTANPKGIKLKVDFGKKAAKMGIEPKSGSYALTIGPKGVEIYGYDERGAYYGLQTLRQIIETSVDGKLPYLTINDYPSLMNRGVVEGFYGTPWSHEVRKSLIKFLGDNKMNTFIYAPKDDPFHSSPNWRKPYPADQAENIRELAEEARRNRVDFVWAIHPGQDIRWNEEDYDSLVMKFNNMYDLGVRSFFIFFDDINGEGTNPNKQVELLNRLNKEFVQAKGDVSNITFCPTDYSRLWANPTQDGSLAIFGRTLDKDIEVMYTGDVVCSDLTRETMEFFDNLVQRPGYYWWNFPVSDYCRNYLLMGPSYGLDTTLTDKEVSALVSNPMEHGEASKIAIYGVGDYAWNIPAYNPMDAWERAIEVLMPENPEALRTFAIHAADTETGYRRDESWETTTFPYNNYTKEQFDALRKDFVAVAEAPKQIMESCKDTLLVKELKPWLVEFEKLGQRGLRTLDLVKAFPNASDEDFWNAYAANIMTAADHEAYSAHKSGTYKLQPFVNNAMNDMLVAFYTKASGKTPLMYRPIGTYRNLGDSMAQLMLDGKTDTYWTSGSGQGKGNWVGLDLREVRPVTEINIRQGRNDVDDVDFFDHAILEASKDGKTWTALTEPMKNQYVIEWKGEPVEARYVRLRRLDSKRSNWMSIRKFEVNPMNEERIGFEVESVEPAAFARIFDGDPSSSYDLNPRGAKFARPEGAETLTFLMGPAPQLAIEQINAQGETLVNERLESPYVKVTLLPETATLRLSGKGTIYEVLH